MKKISTNHAVFWLAFHLIFVTKCRKKLLSEKVSLIVNSAIAKTLNEAGIKIERINGEPDHIHLLIYGTPTTNLAEAIGKAKGYSSFVARKNFPELKQWKAFWSESYALFSVGAGEEMIKHYIENQGKK